MAPMEVASIHGRPHFKFEKIAPAYRKYEQANFWKNFFIKGFQELRLFTSHIFQKLLQWILGYPTPQLSEQYD